LAENLILKYSNSREIAGWLFWCYAALIIGRQTTNPGIEDVGGRFFGVSHSRLSTKRLTKPTFGVDFLLHAVE